MRINHVLEKSGNNEITIQKLQKLYDNLFEISSVLYNRCSEIIEICEERGANVFEKLTEIKDGALRSMEEVDEIGLTNPDFYTCEHRTSTLSKQIKQAKMREGQENVENRGNRKGMGANVLCETEASVV